MPHVRAQQGQAPVQAYEATKAREPELKGLEAGKVIRVFDADEFNDIRLTVVIGMVFATPI